MWADPFTVLRARITLLSAACVWLAACATGAPAGGRSMMADVGYRPFSPAATARAVPAAEAPPVPAAIPPGARDTSLKLARSVVGQKQVIFRGQHYPDDCAGLIKGVYAQLGLDVLAAAQPGDNAVTAIYRFASSRGRIYEGGRPVAGDLVFFKDTYDVNRDGRVNDGLTHIGLVDEVEEDGTVLVIHRVAKGVVRYRMNLSYRDLATSPTGRPVNDWLRPAGSQSRAQLTAQLFAGYATVLPIEPRYQASR